MKNITKIVAFFLLVCLCLPLFSCSEEIDLGEPECVIGDAWSGVVFDDIFYYTTSNGIMRYYDLTNPEAGSYALNTDVLVSENGLSSNPAFVGGGFYAVSPKLTEENGGHHVLIYAQRYMNKNTNSSAFRLLKYDTHTNTVEKIIDGVDITMQSMLLYEDAVVYTVNEERNGWNIYRVDTNGENYIKKDNPRKANYRVVTIYDDRIYYADEKSGKLYSSSLVLDDEKELFDVNITQIWPFIVDERIIYASKTINYIEYEGRKYPSYNLYSRPIDDLSKEELFLENVSAAMYRSGHLYYSYTEPQHITESVVTAYLVLNAYSFETGETKTLYDLSNTHKDRSWTAIGDNYIIFSEYDYSKGDTVQTRTDTTIVLNLATGEETVLPEE